MPMNPTSPLFSLTINERFMVIPKEPPHYHAFPTLIRVDERFWMACRSGKVDQTKPHGADGCVQLFVANAEEPLWWECRGAFFGDEEGSPNELDAILSGPMAGHIFLGTRIYEHRKRNTSFISRWDLSDLAHHSSEVWCPDRSVLKDVSDIDMNCFGHMQKTVSGELLMSGYGTPPKGRKLAPLLLCSDDEGKSWRLRSVLAHSDEKMFLTEFSLGHIGEEKWIALIRNEIKPYPLMVVRSDDDGRTWSPITQTPLRGHAPMLAKTKSGAFLVLYRDLLKDRPGIGIGVSSDNGLSWRRIGRLASYQGNIYDGGYGDLIAMRKNQFLAVYYLCDKERSPWIEGCLFSVREA